MLFLLKNKWCVALPLTPQSDRTAIMVMLLGQSAQQDPVKHLQCRRVTQQLLLAISEVKNPFQVGGEAPLTEEQNSHAGF